MLLAVMKDSRQVIKKEWLMKDRLKYLTRARAYPPKVIISIL